MLLNVVYLVAFVALLPWVAWRKLSGGRAVAAPWTRFTGGSAPLPRTEIVSKLWTYIKKHKLQDNANKRMVNSDEKLKGIFGKSQVSMFEMAGLIGKHVK